MGCVPEVVRKLPSLVPDVRPGDSSKTSATPLFCVGGTGVHPCGQRRNHKRKKHSQRPWLLISGPVGCFGSHPGVALRGDIVKDDSGSTAVFTEQGSSASQMTAAIVMDIISRLPACAGQTADEISTYT